MKRGCLALLMVLALFVSACGDDKKEEGSSSNLPQTVTILDGGLTFRLPEDWMTRTSPELYSTVVFYNTEEILKFNPRVDDLVEIAQRSFADPRPDMLRRLGVEQNLIVGAMMVTPNDEEASGKSPSEIIQMAFDSAEYTLEANEIGTFENGAWAFFRSEESDLDGMIGVVKAGESIAAIIIVTDKLEEHQATFEDIVRSIRLNPGQIPTPTDAPTQPPIITTVAPVLPTEPPVAEGEE